MEQTQTHANTRNKKSDGRYKQEQMCYYVL